jgi:hypothetical protein
VWRSYDKQFVMMKTMMKVNNITSFLLDSLPPLIVLSTIVVWYVENSASSLEEPSTSSGTIALFNGAVNSDDDKTDTESYSNTENINELISSLGNETKDADKPLISTSNSAVSSDSKSGSQNSLFGINKDEDDWNTDSLFASDEDDIDLEETEDESEHRNATKQRRRASTNTDELRMFGFVTIDIRSEEQKAKYSLEVRVLYFNLDETTITVTVHNLSYSAIFALCLERT